MSLKLWASPSSGAPARVPMRSEHSRYSVPIPGSVSVLEREVDDPVLLPVFLGVSESSDPLSAIPFAFVGSLSPYLVVGLPLSFLAHPKSFFLDVHSFLVKSSRLPDASSWMVVDSSSLSVLAASLWFLLIGVLLQLQLGPDEVMTSILCALSSSSWSVVCSMLLARSSSMFAMSCALGRDMLFVFSQTRSHPVSAGFDLHVGADPDMAQEYRALRPLRVHSDSNQSGQSGQTPSPHEGAPISNILLHVQQSVPQHDQHVVLMADQHRYVLPPLGETYSILGSVVGHPSSFCLVGIYHGVGIPEVYIPRGRSPSHLLNRRLFLPSVQRPSVFG